MLQLDYEYTSRLSEDSYRRNKSIRADWTKLTKSQLNDMYNRWKVEYEKLHLLAVTTPQAMSLEYTLNSLINPTEYIYIQSGEWFPEFYIYKLNELYSKDTFIWTLAEIAVSETYIFKDIEFETEQTDFFVIVSNIDIALIPEIEHYVNKFRPAGKTYKIITV